MDPCLHDVQTGNKTGSNTTPKFTNDSGKNCWTFAGKTKT